MNIKWSEFKWILNDQNSGQPFPAGPGGVKSDFFFPFPYFWNNDLKLFNASLLWNHSPGARNTENFRCTNKGVKNSCRLQEQELQAPGQSFGFFLITLRNNFGWRWSQKLGTSNFAVHQKVLYLFNFFKNGNTHWFRLICKFFNWAGLIKFK